MSSQMQSSGRGGAGNIVDASKTTQIQAEDLKTPTLKTSMVTTGRGGTGNMAANLDPEEKRRRQDVEPVVRRYSHGATHVGRGGTGNIAKGNADDATSTGPASPPLQAPSPTERERREKSGSPVIADNAPAAAPRKSDEPGWAEKGMNLLFGKK